MGEFGKLGGIMDLATLKALCTLHATPGDEGDVFHFLEHRWREQGLDVRRLGRYAIVAEPAERKKADTILLVAHADSPGFIVSEVRSAQSLGVLALGGIHEPPATDLLLKTSHGFVPAHLEEPPEGWNRHSPLSVTLSEPCPDVQKGDRLCWAFNWEETSERITSPFLDNRIACAFVADWVARHAAELADCNVILATTAMEEVNGFGANVLARNVEADAAVVLDVTYTNEQQGVALGAGAVLTLSDASVLISGAERDRLLTQCPMLQTEVYNFSGTDARAFPALGAVMPVAPVLLPTEGNHSPKEVISKRDLASWHEAVVAVARALCAKGGAQ